MKSILITGGTGLIGSALSKFLSELNYEVSILSRREILNQSIIENYNWDVKNKILDLNVLRNKEIIIHLAGESISAKRWTNNQKLIIKNSRLNSTSLLYEKIKRLKDKPKLIIAASATGIYPYNTLNKMTENDISKSPEFLVDVVNNWEKELKKFSKLGVRLVILRMGVVLSLKGGMLGKLILPFKLGLGFPIGSGNQLISWIHIEDLNRIFKHCIENKNLRGVYNATSPSPVSNNYFSKTLSKLLNKHFFFNCIRIPSFLIRLLYGEMSDLILHGHNVSSKKIRKSNFKFNYVNLNEAIRHLLKSRL